MINKTYIDDNTLPVYPVCKSMANWLQEQPFIKELFNNSIYTYPRWDLNPQQLPAICIYPTRIHTDGMGFLLYATIKIEMIRNPNLVNRAAILSFQVPIAERVAYSFVFNNDFKLNYLAKNTSWVSLMDSFELEYNEKIHSSTIHIDLEINMQEYMRVAGMYGYNVTGNNKTSYTVDGFIEDGEPKDYEPNS